MSDLIEREDAIKALYKYSFVSKDIIEREINAIPSADRPRGECEFCKDSGFIGAKLMLGNDGRWHKIRYCPNCGAKMREREGE